MIAMFRGKIAFHVALLAALFVLSSAVGTSGADGAPKPFESSIPSASKSGSPSSSGYLVGVGIGDATGPAAEVNLMGYAQTNQTAAGIHMRLFARTFIVVDQSTGERVMYCSVDWGMASQIVTIKVLERLQLLFGGLYNTRNVAISGTHSHSTPAGDLQYVLYQVTSLGFVNESTNAFVDGILDSMVMAHRNLAPGSIKWNWGELKNANINRSPSAYLANPAEERAQYDGNTDYNMTLLRFDGQDGDSLGMFNWFAVHGTSMNNTNELLSGDNKGYASMTFEISKNGADVMPGHGDFVGAFASTNLGDVSPNINGTYCWNSGKPCNFDHSTCDGRNEYCIGRGPGKDMFESTKIIGERQVSMAEALFSSAKDELSGPVDSIHTYVDMTNYQVNVNGTTKHTCKPAMGYSFAAGTTDGPGAFDFIQGDPGTGTPFWNAVRDLLATPSAEQIACQAPKPILLPTGEITKPYAWDPEIVPVSIQRIGQFFILSLPGEFTTMAGRRIRNAVREELIAGGAPDDTVVIISGLTNTYASYITTFEEYQVQRYEGASTIYGPYTHMAYVQIAVGLAKAMMAGQSKSYPAGPSPPDLSGIQLAFLPGVIVDGTPAGKHFGDVLVDAKPSYVAGTTVEVDFVSANPRNNNLRGKSFLTVEQQAADGTWTVVYTDAHFETRYHWSRPNGLSDQSTAHITWAIPSGTSGVFRIQHFGYSKPLVGSPVPFSGVSSVFKVSASPADMSPAHHMFD